MVIAGTINRVAFTAESIIVTEIMKNIWTM